MTEQQETALNNPCRFAFETAQPKFMLVDRHRELSINLTVNSGYEQRG